MKKVIFGLSVAAVIYAGCKKDPSLTETPGGSTASATPYTIVYPKGFSAMPIPADNPMTVEGVALGKRLFFEPLLSGNNQMSCGTCHHQEAAFVDAGKQFSEGITGEKGTRNAMPLFNLGWAKKFFWDGGAIGLENQVLGPITNPVEMHEDLNVAVAELQAHPEYPALFRKAFGTDKVSTALIMKAIAQFERTLISGNSKFDQWQRGQVALTVEELRGYELFTNMEKGDCNHCHVVSSQFTDYELRNNGLDSIFTDEGAEKITLNPLDKGKFKTPSLRNVELTAPYMHDGRFATLEEVVDHYNTGIKHSTTLDPNLQHLAPGRLSQQDVNDLVAFMKTLTDHDFINDPRFKQ